MTTNGRPDSNDLLSAYHDGELPAVESAAVEQLLEVSPDARAEVEDYRALSELLQSLPAEPAPADLRRAVMRRIEREASPKAVRPRKSLRWTLGLIGSGIAVAAGLFLTIGTLDRDPLARNATGFAAHDGVDAETTAIEAAGLAIDSPAALQPTDPPEAFGDVGGGLGGGLGAASVALAPGMSADELAVGDFFSYIEQTQSGDIVVVEATVVDVRRALDQLQVLLSRNSIPTASVAFDERRGLGEEIAATDRATTGELAVFIESEPTRMNAALLELRQQFREESNAILGLQVTGVLDASDTSAPSGGAATHPYFGRGAVPAAAPQPAFTAGASSAAAAGREAAPQPAARASIPSEPRLMTFGAESAAAAPRSNESLNASPMPATAASDRERLSEFGKPAQNEAESYQYGYQTVLNVSKSELKLKQNNAVQTESAESRTDFGVDADALYQNDATEKKLDRQSLARQQADRPANQPEQAAQAQAADATTLQRRVRLLVVLEPQSPVAPVVAPK